LVAGRQSTIASFKGVENFDNGVAVLSEILLAYLNIHLGLVLLNAKLGVLLKPPGWDLTLADATEDRRWQT
jgi:hypothetical protein